LLFGVLDPEIFAFLSGPNRELNGELLLKLYNECFRTDFRFPSQTDVVGVIYAGLAEHGHLWRDEADSAPLDDVASPRGRRLRRRRRSAVSDEATSQALMRARYVYSRLVETGWLTETKFGLKITVGMPAGAIRIAELLCNLREGISEPLGGLVVEVRNAVRAVRASPRESALGLNKAARDATAFGRYLRSVLAALNDVDRNVLASTTLSERLQHYFEDFVERVLLRDYAAISTTSHPYRFRHSILEDIQALEDSPLDLDPVAEAYFEARLTADLRAARDLVHDDIGTIRSVFDSIEEAFERIQQHRSRLEMRLRNTVRYAGRRVGLFLQRSEVLIQRLDRALAEPERLASPIRISGLMWPMQPVLSPELLARPRGPRAPIISDSIVNPETDAVWRFRRQLEREYLARLAVKPQQVLRFLERRVPPFGQGLAADLRIENVDDFLAFEALRLTASFALAGGEDDPLSRRLSEHFSFEPAPDAPMDNLWLSCSGFRVRRLTDHVTLEDARAD
jgi:hypothetical protein